VAQDAHARADIRNLWMAVYMLIACMVGLGVMCLGDKARIDALEQYHEAPQ
jgi:hypothetical protein